MSDWCNNKFFLNTNKEYFIIRQEAYYIKVNKFK